MTGVWSYYPAEGQWRSPSSPAELDRAQYGLTDVHSQGKCAGRVCIIHNPTDHPMRSWELLWRSDRGIFERICKHGVGHPDPDQQDYWAEIGQEWQFVHGCDINPETGMECCTGTEERNG